MKIIRIISWLFLVTCSKIVPTYTAAKSIATKADIQTILRDLKKLYTSNSDTNTATNTNQIMAKYIFRNSIIAKEGGIIETGQEALKVGNQNYATFWGMLKVVSAYNDEKIQKDKNACTIVMTANKGLIETLGNIDINKIPQGSATTKLNGILGDYKIYIGTKAFQNKDKMFNAAVTWEDKTLQNSDAYVRNAQFIENIILSVDECTTLCGQNKGWHRNYLVAASVVAFLTGIFVQAFHTEIRKNEKTHPKDNKAKRTYDLAHEPSASPQNVPPSVPPKK